MDVLPGLRARPLALSDVDAVVGLIAAEEQANLGEVMIERADIVSDWQRPSFNLGASGIAILEGDAMVAFGEVTYPQRCDVAVLPSHHGRGIGTWLATWIRDIARHQGSTIIGMPVPEGSPGDKLLAGLGYHVRWSSWMLELPEGKEIVRQDLPEGYSVRGVNPDEHRAVWTVVEDAFLEWSQRERQSFEDFDATVFGRPDYEPWQLRVALDPAGDVVGVAFVTLSAGDAYIEKLAVRRDQRNRGLARALLADAFTIARQHGGGTATLSTDSRTGALSLYEKVGMVVTQTWVHRAINL